MSSLSGPVGPSCEDPVKSVDGRLRSPGSGGGAGSGERPDMAVELNHNHTNAANWRYSTALSAVTMRGGWKTGCCQSMQRNGTADATGRWEPAGSPSKRLSWRSAAPTAQRGQGAVLCYHCEEIPISSTKTRNIANPNINPAMRINDHKSRNQSRIQQRKPMSMQCHCGRRSARSRVHCSRSEGFRVSASTLQVEGGVRVVGVKVLTRVLRSAMRPELRSSPNVAQRI